jgi:hypothetical protein
MPSLQALASENHYLRVLMSQRDAGIEEGDDDGDDGDDGDDAVSWHSDDGKVARRTR